jgi:inosine-uridine nucleoside N-ribohydrolase
MCQNWTVTEIESRSLLMNALVFSCRRRCLIQVCFALCLMVLITPLALAVGQEQPTGKFKAIPVIFDTDIGNDIDDTWALGFLLKCPELDLKLAVGDRGRAPYRAKLLAKFLERVGRADVPVGIGLDIKPKGEGRQAEWVKDYDLKSYPGRVLQDGVQAIIDTIMKSDRPVTLICVGPVPNIAEALKREPRIAQRARFVGMHGSLRKGYNDEDKPVPEANVKGDPKACQAAFAAPWEVIITPLDTCGLVVLSGDKYQRVRDSKDPIASNIIANYRIWAAAGSAAGLDMAQNRSSVLFDTVAVYLAFRQDYCVMEKLGVRVTDNGCTLEDPTSRLLNVALRWKDLNTFEELLVQRLTGGR